MFVYREEYYLSKSEPERKDNETTEKYNERYDNWTKRLEKSAGLAEILIAKQRHGPVGNVTVQFEGRLTKFHDQSPQIIFQKIFNRFICKKIPKLKFMYLTRFFWEPICVD